MIAVLIALLLPAVQAGRELAAKLEKEKFINRFIEQIEEQTHISLTRKNAVTLISLAKTL